LSRLRALLAAAGALAARAALADPLPETGYGLPRDASRDGFRVDELIHFTLAAIAVIFAIAAAALVWSFLKHRRDHPAVYTHGTRASTAAVLVFVGVVLFTVDGSLFVRTLRDVDRYFWAFARAEEDPAAIRIEVNAHQWSWTVRYPGPDGQFDTPDDIVTIDAIHVPLGAPVVIQLASTDVIHSMYLPNFRVKQDAVPGMITRLTFQAAEPGEYEIACAQHCGANHYKMRGVLTVLPPDAYRAWLETATADARRAYDPDDREAHWGWPWRAEP